MRPSFLGVLMFSALCLLVAGWGEEDYEIFRLRDELLLHEGEDVTFYDFVGVTSGASQDDINKAYRKKSKLLHPDKAKAAFLAERAAARGKPTPGKKPGVYVNKQSSEKEIQKAIKVASDRFTRLGLIAAILRGPGRERYDHFLSNGFPRWRGTGYYYARFRPGLGSTLIGLFVFGAGVVHYVVLVLNRRKQVEFVERYIKQARKSAWGDDSPMMNIPGIDSVAATSEADGAGHDDGMTGMNRRQKRQQEKEARKGKETKKSQSTSISASRSGTHTPQETNPTGPQGARKRVQAENGKVLLVDSLGDVYLEEQNDAGETEQLLLDPLEIQPPTVKDTFLYRLPVFVYHSVTSRLMGIGKESVRAIDDGEEAEAALLVPASGSAARKRRSRGRQ